MLIGARDPAAMTPAQRAVYDAIAAGPRGDVPWPFLAMLDAPHLAEAIQAVGAAIRFSGALTAELREIAILATAAAFGSGYEWDYHIAIARRLGIGERAIAACASGTEDPAIGEAFAAVVALCRAAVRDRRIGEDVLARLVAATSREIASEVVAITGYYQMLALYLSAGALDHPVAYPG